MVAHGPANEPVKSVEFDFYFLNAVIDVKY